ncbi:hypothetical protein KZZ52_47380 [Dactylosporangium sp. AC04546]|uniref:hypothetical protein n=1 Tax=Dactylosporangium sp. AC04546 TaxID=2862460 RepID=UPI001EDDD65E|nr:hypothetical protein [Dactylosporangium sp. AC04546]WVK81536.1 hypothetical protein KZZ52_47380 [Dactylosporangium sp. AC04546]
MVTWAQVVLLNDRPLRYELVQALRIMTTVHPQVYRPRLARALCTLVDDFAPATPPAATTPLLSEAAGHLREWSAEAVRTNAFQEPITRRRTHNDGPDWDLLALSVALETAGRRDAALSAIEALVTADRARRGTPRSRLARALLHQAAMLARRDRTPAATTLREEAERLLRPAGPEPISNELASLLTDAPLPRAPKQRPTPTTSQTIPIRH